MKDSLKCTVTVRADTMFDFGIEEWTVLIIVGAIVLFFIFHTTIHKGKWGKS